MAVTERTVLLDRSLDTEGAPHGDLWASARSRAEQLAARDGIDDVVVFADAAHRVPLWALQDICWSFRYGTNLSVGLDLALAFTRPGGAITVVIYSPPDACLEGDGVLFLDFADTTGAVAAATRRSAERCVDKQVRVDVVQLGTRVGALPEVVCAMTGGELVLLADH